jgi:hypothetical protein
MYDARLFMIIIEHHHQPISKLFRKKLHPRCLFDFRQGRS